MVKCHKKIECLSGKSDGKAFDPSPGVRSKLSVCAASQIARLLAHGLIS